MAARATSGLIANKGTCPKCDETISSVDIEHVDIKEGPLTKWHGVSLLCPYCSCVLGVSVDPVGLKDDIVELVVAQAIRRGA